MRCSAVRCVTSQLLVATYIVFYHITACSRCLWCRSAVCGSDGIMYGSECLMREESCKQQRDIIAVEHDLCEGAALTFHPFDL